MAAKQIIIVGFEEKDTRALLFVLEGTEYAAFTTGSLPDAVIHLQEKSFGALIIDLDHASLDNRLLKQIRAKHPNLCLIGLSSRSFHPELEEALSLYIDACFSKSPGYEELLYWLKGGFEPTIHKNEETCGSGGEPVERS